MSTPRSTAGVIGSLRLILPSLRALLLTTLQLLETIVGPGTIYGGHVDL
jgi:hypothetical protein